jgi:hypothetical protein
MAVTEFKAPAEIAVQTGAANAPADLDASSLGIPDPIDRGTATARQPVGDHVQSVTMSDGVITATSVPGNISVDNDGSTGVTYTMTATINNGGVTWDMGGTCVTEGLCAVTNN